MGRMLAVLPVFLPPLIIVALILLARSPIEPGFMGGGISSRDRDLMIRVAMWEARHEPRLGKIAVVWVILNRQKSNPYGWQTISDVVTAPRQFEPWLYHKKQLLALPRRSREYIQMSKIVDDVLSQRLADPTNGAFYFLNVSTVKTRNKGKLSRAWRRIVANPHCRKIARHTFCPR